MFNVTVNTIIWANDIKGRVIKPGDVLVILPITGIRHTVTQGETIATIAAKYKGDEAEIASYNELALSASLETGQVVIIPNGEISPPPAPKPSQTAKKSGVAVTAKLTGGGGPSYSGYYIWPVAGGVLTQGIHGYNGIDIGAPKGTAIYASAAGTVIISRNNGGWNGGYGNYVVIQHDNGTQTLYSHNSSVSVSVGETVAQGQTIGLVGSTGLSTGNHVHFEVRGATNPFK